MVPVLGAESNDPADELCVKTIFAARAPPGKLELPEVSAALAPGALDVAAAGVRALESLLLLGSVAGSTKHPLTVIPAASKLAASRGEIDINRGAV